MQKAMHRLAFLKLMVDF